MAEDKDPFLARWSRRKLEVAKAPAAAAPAAPAAAEAPVLPALDSLTFESDFTAFMHAKVDEGVKRAALKKLFSDPRFNVMDGLDTYIDDYTKNDGISEEMLKTLKHSRTTLFGQPTAQEKQAEAEARALAQAQPKPEPADARKEDGDTRQDT
jgi:uncharacterized protein DUF3306